MPDNIATLIYRVLFPLSRSFHRRGNKTFFPAVFNEKRQPREQNGNLMSKERFPFSPKGPRKKEVYNYATTGWFTIILICKKLLCEIVSFSKNFSLENFRNLTFFLSFSRGPFIRILRRFLWNNSLDDIVNRRFDKSVCVIGVEGLVERMKNMYSV